MSFDYHSEQKKQAFCQGGAAGNSLDKTAYMFDFLCILA
jgi:hypothetical protein